MIQIALFSLFFTLQILRKCWWKWPKKQNVQNSTFCLWPEILTPWCSENKSKNEQKKSWHPSIFWYLCKPLFRSPEISWFSSKHLKTLVITVDVFKLIKNNNLKFISFIVQNLSTEKRAVKLMQSRKTRFYNINYSL